MSFYGSIGTKLHHEQQESALCERNYYHSQQTNDNYSVVNTFPEGSVEDLDCKEKEVKRQVNYLHPAIWMALMRLLHGLLHLDQTLEVGKE